jgi:metal-dependent hydrolase (beta-lactamase superfamily II)
VRVVRWIAAGLAIVLLVGVVGVVLRLVAHARGVAAVEREIAERPLARLGAFGSTTTLRVMPLLDWHVSRPELLGDAGVSYWIETDATRILFDTGMNSTKASPSPLEHNMAALGVGLADVDVVFLSHAHFDHVGGPKWTNGSITGSTFGIGNEQPSLAGKRAIVPTEMTYPGLEPTVTREPAILAPGVATTGTIPRRTFAGRIEEQALVVHVEGKGLVLIVGCGHQTLAHLLDRVAAVFDEPLYGIIGGLHYPVPEGRLRWRGIDVQRRLGSGSGPLSPLTEADVRRDIARLAEHDIGFVAVGGHDSSDEAIGWFRDRFGAASHALRVGEALLVAP